MAWNEPAGDKKDNDPWNNGNKRPQDNPPDLDVIFTKLVNRFKALFGGQQRSNTPSGSNNSTSSQAGVGKGGTFLLVAGLVLALIIWVLAGIFIVDPAERAVVLRFGKYTETLMPGPHWIPHFIESKYIVNVNKVYNYSYSEMMLTKDENIVSVSIAVQYKVSNAEDYLFNVNNPVESLKQATASALRQVIGSTSLDDVLTVGREKVRQEVAVQIAETLKSYNAGLMVTDAAMQPAKAPEEVKDAFDDAIKAQEDEQRYINQAQAYAMGVVPTAQGQAKRIEQEALAYKEQVVLIAQGDIARFVALLPEYKIAPEVTRQRLYLETMENVLSKSSKIVVDTGSNNNMLYLPLEKLIQPSNIAPLSGLSRMGINTDENVYNASTSSSMNVPLRQGYGHINRDAYDQREQP